MEQQHRGEAGSDYGERRQSCLLVAIERGKREHLSRKRVEVEGAEQKGGRQLLHRVDESKEACGAERGPEQRKMHAEQRLAHRSAERAGYGVDIAGDLAQSR